MAFTPKFYRECVDLIDFSGLTLPYRSSMQRCIERGCPPGDALLLVLENDLKAILLFDDPSALRKVFSWVNGELPSPIWGSPQKVKMWMRLAHSQWRAPDAPAARTADDAPFAPPRAMSADLDALMRR
jgi:hypothetical protein